MDHDTVGSRVAALRALIDLDPVELGKLAGLKSPAHVAMIEDGSRAKRISADTALALADVLGCSVKYLVRGEGEPPSANTVRRAVSRAKAALAHREAA